MPILTHTDLSVSPICLGAVQYGTGLSEQEAIDQLDRYTGAGGNFIDTALVYGVWGPEGRPTSEPIIGKFLARSGKRNQLILSTKGAHPPFNAMSHSRMHPDLIAADLEQSLRHLGTDTIDLYFLHRDDPSVPVAEILGCLNELRRAGKIRTFGCSNWTLARIKQAELWAAGQGSAGFICNQLLWSLAKINFSHFPDKTCVAMDPPMYRWHAQTQMAAMAYTSTARGYFSKRRAGLASEQQLLLYGNAHNERTFDGLNTLARESGYTLQQLSLLYFADQPFPAVPIVSCSNRQQLNEMIGCLDISLPADLQRRLKALGK